MEDYDLLQVYKKGKPVSIQYIKLSGNDKFGLIPEAKQITVLGRVYNVRHIIALRPFENVKVGDIGGCVSGSDVLDMVDNSWIEYGAVVVGDSQVTGDSYIESLQVVSSTIHNASEVAGYNSNAIIADSTISMSVIDNIEEVVESDIAGCDMEAFDRITINSSILKHIRLNNVLSKSDEEGVICIRSSKLFNIVFEKSVDLSNVEIVLSKHDEECTVDRIILTEQVSYIGDSIKVTVSRTFNKNKRFTWDELLAADELKEELSSEQLIEEAANKVDNGSKPTDIQEESSKYTESKSAKGDIESLLAGMFSK
ncbi:hypothetical protein [Bacteroides acidifaciens]|uniref:hypothetical protein n=1 Tax=Bacteroides acidifaciens TaxID=85831 RepID=UPI0025A94F71|nr:hypothetical protein [Bacteroides acidifaciens]